VTSPWIPHGYVPRGECRASACDHGLAQGRQAAVAVSGGTHGDGRGLRFPLAGLDESPAPAGADVLDVSEWGGNQSLSWWRFVKPVQTKEFLSFGDARIRRGFLRSLTDMVRARDKPRSYEFPTLTMCACGEQTGYEGRVGP
jgi:hypothetical protein